MDGSNLDEDGNKLYETETGGIGEEAAGWSALIQKETSLGGSSESLIPQESEKTDIARFSEEAKKALGDMGYVIYDPSGRSIRSLITKDNMSFKSHWHNDDPDFEALPSRRSEIAINPNQFFLPESNNKTLSEQEAMIERFSTEISAKISSVEAVLGEAADYAALTFLSPEDKKLFGEQYGYNYTRTKTSTSPSSRQANQPLFDDDESGVAVEVGNNRSDSGLFVMRYSPEGRVDNLYAAPIIVPKPSI